MRLVNVEITIFTQSVQPGRPEQKGVDPDQMMYSAVSDQGLHCIPLVQQFLAAGTGSKIGLFNPCHAE